MVLKKLFYSVAFLAFIPFIIKGQSHRDSYAGEIKKITEAIKATKNIQYAYSMHVEFPDGETDGMKGEIYFGGDEKLMYNSGDAFTMIYTSQWYYNADHRQKSISIINLKKHLNKDFKKDMDKNVFQNAGVSYFFDSVILKYAIVKKMKKEDDLIDMELQFPAASPIKTMAIVFNEKEKMIVSYTVTTFEPWPDNEFGKNKGTTKVVICTGFRKITDDKEYKTDNFFIAKKGNVTLKKYEKYKLNVKL